MNAIMQRLSPNLRAVSHSETLLINELSNRAAANGQTLYRFGFGQSPFPVPDQVVQALGEAAHRKEYVDVQGLPALRRAIEPGPSSRQSLCSCRARWCPNTAWLGRRQTETTSSRALPESRAAPWQRDPESPYDQPAAHRSPFAGRAQRREP